MATTVPVAEVAGYTVRQAGLGTLGLMVASALRWKRKNASLGQRLWNNSTTPPEESVECEFEKVTRRLGLTTEDEMRRSHALRTWAKKHRSFRYVPDGLLIFWGLELDDEAILP